ncbi:type VI secretion system-associated FHA domain protein TagH [Caulobacter sp. LARHSG274]
MTLILTIKNVAQLDNGEPTRLVLDRHGAVIGRSPHADWSLPDPKSYISSTHCEIDFRDGAYLLIDKSTNGTFVNGSTERLTAPHPLTTQDEITIGHYRVVAEVSGVAAPASTVNKAPAEGWGWEAPAASGSPPASPGWDTPPPAAPSLGAPPVRPAPVPAPAASAGGWAPAPAAPSAAWAPATPPPAAADPWAAAPPPAPAPSSGSGPPPAWGPPTPSERSVVDAWGSLPTPGETAPAPPPAESASAMSGRGAMAHSWAAPQLQSPPPPPPAPIAETPAADDVWGKFVSVNTVDWGTETFAAPPAPAPIPVAAAATAPTYPAQAGGQETWTAFLAAAGLNPADIKVSPATAAAASGGLVKRLVAGLVLMLDARARAKAQLGAQSTALNFDGNNPLKFARSADKVLAQLLNAPERGFMDADRAVEDALQDLQAHQMATLAAMQGALRSTLDRFSPTAIRERAETRGLLARILPGARDAALWQAYEREFEGVARGSDEAFMDVFAKAFKEAYEQASAQMKRPR